MGETYEIWRVQNSPNVSMCVLFLFSIVCIVIKKTNCTCRCVSAFPPSLSQDAAAGGARASAVSVVSWWAVVPAPSWERSGLSEISQWDLHRAPWRSTHAAAFSLADFLAISAPPHSAAIYDSALCYHNPPGWANASLEGERKEGDW